MYVEQPEQWVTPEWVNYFVDFLTSKNLEEWEHKKEYEQNKKLHVGKTNYFINL